MTRKEQVQMLSDIANAIVKQDLILKMLSDGFSDISREILILRRAKETFDYGEVIEESDDVDLDDVPPKEVEDD